MCVFVSTKTLATHSTYQDTSAFLMIVDSGQMQSGTPMLASLLYVDDIAMLTHDAQALDLVQLGGQMDGRLLLIVQYARINRTVNTGWMGYINHRATTAACSWLAATYIESK